MKRYINLIWGKRTAKLSISKILLVSLILFSTFIVSAAPQNPIFNPLIKDAHNNIVPFTFQFKDRATGQQINPISKGRIAPGLYDLELTLMNNPIKKIMIKGLVINNDIVSFLNVDDTPENIKAKSSLWSGVLAIDPSYIDFDNITMLINSTGNKLYKCSEWDFFGRNCNGRWIRQPTKIKAGELYEVTIFNATDPGYSEINATDAQQLDTNYNFISNIWDSVKTEDNIWSDKINYSNYIRVYFEHELEQENVIDVVARNTQDINCTIELYEANSSNLLATSRLLYYDDYDNITPYHYTSYYEHFKIGQNITPSDVFDLKMSGDPNCKLEFDYIHDAITGVSIGTDATSKPPSNATPVQFDAILKNATGKIFMAVNDKVCYTNDNSYKAITCYYPFTVGTASNFSCAITSYGRVGCIYENNTYTSISFAWSDSWASASPVWNVVKLNNSFSATYNSNYFMRTGSLIVDKDDNFHGCSIPSVQKGGIAIPGGSPDENVTWWVNSSNGLTWSATNISNNAWWGSTCDIESRSLDDGTVQIHIINMDWFINVVARGRIMHMNFTPSSNPIPTETQVATSTASSFPQTTSMSLTTDREGTLYIAKASLSDDWNIWVSKNGGLNWATKSVDAPETTQETDYTDCISDNTNSIRCIFQQDYGTTDDKLYYMNSSNNATDWGGNVTLQNGTSAGDDAGYAHQLGSSYPAFNNPRYSATAGLLHYFFWTDSGTDGWYYANYSYQWIDTTRPQWRNLYNNASNGTSLANSWFSVQCFDESNISAIIFATTNGSATFTNITKTNFANPDYYATFNQTLQHINTCAKTITWKFYCNDTAGNWMETQNYSYQTADCVSTLTRNMSVFRFVVLNTTTRRNISMITLDKNGNIIEQFEVPKLKAITSTNINFITLKVNPIRNETAVLYQTAGSSNSEFATYLNIYNGSAWKMWRLNRNWGAGSYWKNGGMCYTPDGDLIIGMVNVTENQGHSNMKVHRYDGVQLYNYTGPSIQNAQVDSVDTSCNFIDNNVIITYYRYISTTYGNLKAAIFTDTNIFINDTVFQSEVLSTVYAYYGSLAGYGAESWSSGWLVNGTGYVCYDNRSRSTNPVHECVFWTPEEKHWGNNMRGKNSLSGTIFYPSSSHSSYFNNTFMRMYIDSNQDVQSDFFNITSFTYGDEYSPSSTYYYSVDMFAFSNNTNDDGIFIYKDTSSSPNQLVYKNWSNGIASSSYGIVAKGSPNQIRLFSDRYTEHILIGETNSTGNLTFFRYNTTYKYPTIFYILPSTVPSGDPGNQYYSGDFMPPSYNSIDSQSPYWTNNLTPSDTFRIATSTNFCVNLNDNFPQSGLYMFALNDSGWQNTSDKIWTPNQQVCNTSTIKSKRGSLIQWKWYFNDSTGNKNETDIFSKVVINSPVTFDYYPSDYIVSGVDGYNTTFYIANCNDADGDAYSVEWFINGTKNITGSSCISLNYNWTYGKAGKDENITVVINDSVENVTHEWLLRIRSPPSCSNPSENYPPSYSNYKYGQVVIMNTTCSAGINSVQDVKLQFYDSHNTSFDELTDLGGGVYKYQASNFSAGTTRHCWMITDNLGNNNYLDCDNDQWEYVVNKSNVSMDFYINVTSPINYNESFNISCNSSSIGATICLYKNETVLKCSPTIGGGESIDYQFEHNISAGVYNISCRSSTSHQNYTDTRISYILNIQKIQRTCSLSFTQNPVILPNAVYATALCSPLGDNMDYNMYRELDPAFPDTDLYNFTNESGVAATISTTGEYYYIVNISETENYTFANTDDYLDIVGANNPPTADLQSPNNATTLTDFTVLLDWYCYDPDSNNLNTTVFVNESMANLLTSNKTTYFNVNSTLLSNQSYNYSTLVNGQTYYWQILCNDSNGGYAYSPIWMFKYSIGTLDGQPCISDSECVSGHLCDNDLMGLTDDYVCYDPSATYFQNEGGTNYCEYDTNNLDNWYCDERLPGTNTTTCNNYDKTYFADTCTIATCSLNDTYVCQSADSLSVGDGCTASPECNGIENGTGQCTSECVYDPCIPPTNGDWLLSNIQCTYRNVVLYIAKSWNLSNAIVHGVNAIFNFTSTYSYISLNLSSTSYFNLTNVTIGGLK